MRMILLALFSVALVLTGCAQSGYYSQDMATQKAETQLADSAQSIQNSLIELASIQKAVHPAAKLPTPPNAAAIGMGNVASIDWTGTIEPVLRNIAQVTNYKLHIIGKAPAIPVIVSLHEQNVAIATILRDAAFQCGNRVDIVVYPRSKIIELRYARV